MMVIQKQEKERCFLFEIVANRKTGIDVDKWDYFERDSKYLNVPTDFQARYVPSLARQLSHTLGVGVACETRV